MSYFRLALIQLFFLGLAACGGGGGSSGNGGSPGGGGNPPANQAPIVIAGTNQTVTEGDVVTLTATASDADGSISSYSWAETTGAAITLNGADSASLSFTAPDVDVETTYTFTVTVTDNDGASARTSVSVIVKVFDPNLAPTVFAGDDQSVDEQSIVTLSGSAEDADGQIVSYLWSQVSGIAVTLNNANMASATFTAPDIIQDETLVFSLTVQDDKGAETSDTVTISLKRFPNVAPTVSAGDDINIEEQSDITLTASAEDVDGSIVSYMWEQISGTQVRLYTTNQAQLEFTTPNVDTEETLIFKVTVTDQEGATSSDEVDVRLSLLVADYFIDTNDPTLVRFVDSHYLNYRLDLDFRGNSNAPASHQRGQYNVSYLASDDPVIFPDGNQSIKKTYQVKIANKVISSLNQEITQFSDSSDTSTSEIAFIERRTGNIFGLRFEDNTSKGMLIIPGEPTIGFNSNVTFENHLYDDPNKEGDSSATYSVHQVIDIDRIEVIKTPFGNFEAFRMQYEYSETDPNAKVDSQIGTFWLYPGLGFIKAEYVETIGTVTPAAVTDIYYTIAETNIAY